MPVLAIPGNHDEREAFRRTFRWPRVGCRLIEVDLIMWADDRGPVRIVALDVTLPGLPHGAVSEDEERRGSIACWRPSLTGRRSS